LQITPEDALPKQVCKACHYQLEKTHLFRAKSKEAEAKLKKHIRLVNAGKKSSLLDDDGEDDDFEEEHAPSFVSIRS
jgi:Zinc-finger associated domain (zf-AD)